MRPNAALVSGLGATVGPVLHVWEHMENGTHLDSGHAPILVNGSYTCCFTDDWEEGERSGVKPTLELRVWFANRFAFGIETQALGGEVYVRGTGDSVARRRNWCCLCTTRTWWATTI